MHGLSTAVEHFDSGDGDIATVSTSSTRDSSKVRSMSTNDTDMSRLGTGPELSVGRKNELDTGAGGTKAGIAMPIGNIISSASPPLPVLFVPVGGGPPIRRNSSSSKDLASLTSLVPLDTTTNRSRGPSPDLTAMMTSVATKLTFEEKSRPPENEEDIDYGESQGFKPIQKIPIKRRGSKTLGLDAQGWSPPPPPH